MRKGKKIVLNFQTLYCIDIFYCSYEAEIKDISKFMKQKSKTFQNLIKLAFSVIFSKGDTVLFSSVLNET